MDPDGVSSKSSKDDVESASSSKETLVLSKSTDKNNKPLTKLTPTRKGVENAKQKLRAFSIQKKNTISPIAAPKTTTNSSTATVIIGKLAGVKVTPKVEPDPEQKKPPKPPKPGTSRLQDSYTQLQKRTLTEIEDMKRKMELVELGIPLGLICPTSTSDKAMPTKAMPPIKSLLDPAKVDEIIREAKKAKQEGREFKFDYNKLLPDYDNPFQKKKKDTGSEKERWLERRRSESESERDKDRRSSEKYDIKRYDYKKDSKYRDKDRKYDEPQRDNSDEKETDVNLNDYLVCDSRSLENDDKNSTSSPKVLDMPSTSIQYLKIPLPPEPTISKNIDTLKSVSVDSPKTDAIKIGELQPVIDSFEFEIDPNEDETLDTLEGDSKLGKYGQQTKIKTISYYDSPAKIDYEQDNTKDSMEGLDDALVDRVYGCDQIPEGVCPRSRAWYPRPGLCAEAAPLPLASEWEADDSQPPDRAEHSDACATPLRSDDMSLDIEYQRFIEAVWPDVIESKNSETPRSTTPVRQESRKKKKEDVEKDAEERKPKKIKLSSKGCSHKSDVEEEDKSKKQKMEKQKAKSRKRKHSTSTLSSSVSETDDDTRKKRKLLKKKISHDSEDQSKDESNESIQHLESEEQLQDIAFKAPKIIPKKKRKPDETQKRMDEAYTYLKQLNQMPRKDVCSLYCDLLAEKLRSLQEHTREVAMLEIDKLVFNMKRQEEKQQFHQPGYYTTATVIRSIQPLNQSPYRSPQYSPSSSSQSPVYQSPDPHIPSQTSYIQTIPNPQQSPSIQSPQGSSSFPLSFHPQPSCSSQSLVYQSPDPHTPLRALYTQTILNPQESTSIQSPQSSSSFPLSFHPQLSFSSQSPVYQSPDPHTPSQALYTQTIPNPQQSPSTRTN